MDVVFEGGVFKAKVSVTETPIFVAMRPANAPVVHCGNLITPEAVTCNSATLAINGQGLPFTSYQVWYIKQSHVNALGINVDAPDFSPFAFDQAGNPVWHQYQHDVPANYPNIIVSGLEPGTAYYIYVIPQSANGMPVDNNGNAAYCYEQVTTASGNTPSCAIPIVSSMIIYDSNVAPADEGGLFDDQQGSSLDLCLLDNISSSQPFLDWQSTGNPDRQLILDLGANYLIDEFTVFDGMSAGVFTIDGSLDNATFENMTEYYTNSLDEWVHLSNLPQNVDGHRYFRFTNPDRLAQVKEVLLCGREACLLNDNAANLSYCLDYDPDLGPWAIGCNSFRFRVKNPTPTGPPYKKVEIWYTQSGPFNEGEHPTVTHAGAPSIVTDLFSITIPGGWFSGTHWFVDVTGLPGQGTYWFAYRMLDGDGRSSRLFVMNNSYSTRLCTRDLGIGPVLDEDCFVDGAWWQINDPQGGGHFQVVETDGQTTNPLASPNKTTNIQVLLNQLDYQYFVDTTDEASYSTSWVYVKRVYQNLSATGWEGIKVGLDSLCEDELNDRSSDGLHGRSLEKTSAHYLFPNPASGTVTLVTGTAAYDSYTVLDVAGREVARGTLGAEDEHTLDISLLSGGFYCMKLHGDPAGPGLLKFVVR